MGRLSWTRIAAVGMLLFMGSAGEPCIAGETVRTYSTEDRDSIHLGNQFIKLQFAKSKGQVMSVVHRRSGSDLRQEKANAYKTIWGLSAEAAGGKSAYTDSARSGGGFGYTNAKLSGAVRLNMVWRGLQLDNGEKYPAEVRVAVTISDGSPLSIWTMEVGNRGNRTIWSISFPLIAGVKELGASGEDDRLVSASSGKRAKDIEGRN